MQPVLVLGNARALPPHGDDAAQMRAFVPDAFGVILVMFIQEKERGFRIVQHVDVFFQDVSSVEVQGGAARHRDAEIDLDDLGAVSHQFGDAIAGF